MDLKHFAGINCLLDALFPKKGGTRLLNLNFCVLDPLITEEELCQEFLAALEAHSKDDLLEQDSLDNYLRSAH